MTYRKFLLPAILLCIGIMAYFYSVAFITALTLKNEHMPITAGIGAMTACLIWFVFNRKFISQKNKKPFPHFLSFLSGMLQVLITMVIMIIVFFIMIFVSEHASVSSRDLGMVFQIPQMIIFGPLFLSIVKPFLFWSALLLGGISNVAFLYLCRRVSQ